MNLRSNQNLRNNAYLRTSFSLTIIMTITPMMQYIQDRILEAVHWCSLEEARKKDLKFWCILLRKFDDWSSFLETLLHFERDTFYLLSTSWWVTNSYAVYWKPIEIIWLPPTLSRVLTALWNEYCMLDYWSIRNKTNAYRKVWDRKHLNEDKSEASLFDQSQDTITAIWVLLWWTDE